jgi:diguanylate cyclase (GGDEF)-like protein
LKRASRQQLLEEELRGLNDLLSVAQVVVSSLELDDVLGDILGSAMTIMEMPAGSIALYDRSSNQLQLHAHQGLSKNFTSRVSWTVKGGGLTATILSKGDLYIIEDTRNAEFFKNPLAISEGICSLIAVPLKIQDKIVGILYLNDFVPRCFGETRLRLLSILSSFASMSIDNAQLHEQTIALACTDGLTGLYNHRQFKNILPEELARARRYEKSMALIMLDLDDFKLFNDRYGHPVGDKALKAVAEILKDTLRDCDYSFRCGGDEFMVLLPEAELGKAVAVGERLCDRIGKEPTRQLEGLAEHNFTVSVGVALYPRDAQTIEGLLKAVDELLYVAKRQGKNKVYHLPD